MNDTSFKRILGHLVLAAAVIASLACIGWILLDSVIMPRVARQGWPVVTVPSLEGLDKDAAQARLDSLGLEPTIDPTLRSSDRLPPDVVAAQIPEAGDSVKKGHVVRIWMSAGPTSVAVPELAGRDSATAARLLRESDLAISDSISWLESPLPYGSVVSTQPKSGTLLRRGASIALVLSAGDSTAPPSDSAKPRIF